MHPQNNVSMTFLEAFRCTIYAIDGMVFALSILLGQTRASTLPRSCYITHSHIITHGTQPSDKTRGAR